MPLTPKMTAKSTTSVCVQFAYSHLQRSVNSDLTLGLGASMQYTRPSKFTHHVQPLFNALAGAVQGGPKK